jgi:hypothetical protein
MQEEREDEKNNGSLAECFRPLQPREQGEYQDDDVQHHCLKERLRLVKEELEPRPRQLRWNRFGKILVVLSDDLVESGHIIVSISGDQISVNDSGRRHFPRANGVKK